MLCDPEWEGRDFKRGSCWVQLLMPRSGWEAEERVPALGTSALLTWMPGRNPTTFGGFHLSPDHAKFHIGFPYLKKKSKGSFLTLFPGLLRSWIIARAASLAACVATGKCTNVLKEFSLVSTLWHLGMERAESLPLLNPQIAPFHLVWLEREGRKKPEAQRMSCWHVGKPCSCCSLTCSRVAPINHLSHTKGAFSFR